MKRTVKKALTLILACSMLALSACGNSENTNTNNEAPASVSFAVSAEPDNLDPMMSSATDTAGIMMNIYEGLLSFDENGNFLPALASEWNIEDDGLTYSFTLREGIKYHNDKPFTADDVVFTYTKLSGLDGNTPLNKSLADVLESVEKVDDMHVKLHLKHVDSGFLCKCILPIQQKDYNQDGTFPMGTGPYKFKEYLQGHKLTLVKNENYSTMEERKPQIENIEFKIITDENAAIMALKSGGLDIAAVSPINAKVLEKDFTIVDGLRNNVQVMSLNNSRAPFDNIKVREAVNYAINKEEIIQNVTMGYGKRVDSFLSPRMSFFFNNEMDVFETDTEKAKSLLKEAGYENGLTFTITVPSNYKIHMDTAQIIREQLAKADITMEIEPVEWAQWLDRVYTKADYTASIVGHSGKLDPQDFLNRFSTPYARNYFKYSDPEYDQLIVDAASTTNENERAAIYKKCQQKLKDDSAAVYIQDPYLIYAVNPKIEGMKIYPMTFFDMGSLRLAQ